MVVWGAGPVGLGGSSASYRPLGRRPGSSPIPPCRPRRRSSPPGRRCGRRMCTSSPCRCGQPPAGLVDARWIRAPGRRPAPVPGQHGRYELLDMSDRGGRAARRGAMRGCHVDPVNHPATCPNCVTSWIAPGTATCWRPRTRVPSGWTCDAGFPGRLGGARTTLRALAPDPATGPDEPPRPVGPRRSPAVPADRDHRSDMAIWSMPDGTLARLNEGPPQPALYLPARDRWHGRLLQTGSPEAGRRAGRLWAGLSRNHARATRRTGRSRRWPQRYVAAILAHQPEGPYELVGNSMGGFIAVEIAHRLPAPPVGRSPWSGSSTSRRPAARCPSG